MIQANNRQTDGAYTNTVHKYLID